jgi:hypothetical protein
MGRRRQLYYASNTVESGLIALEGEFILQDTLEPYVGEYCIANATHLTGTSPTPESKELIPTLGPYGKKFKDENSVKYFQLTRKDFTNHTMPLIHYPTPDEEDYDKGQFQRFFVQKINEPTKLYEVDETQYKEVNRDNKVGIDKRLYEKFEIQWMLVGSDAEFINRQNISIQSKHNPGLDIYLQNTSQFIRGSVSEDRFYPDNEIIDSKLPSDYGLTAVESQVCDNCKFKNYNFCTKWQANIRENYWCHEWQAIPE